MTTNLIVWSSEFHTTPRAAVGGKAKGLGALSSAGLPTPEGFCISARTFQLFAEVHSLVQRLRGFDEAATLSVAATQLIANEPFDPVVAEKIVGAVAMLARADCRQLAVRSSSTLEDEQHALAAGIYDSFIDVAPVEVVRCVRLVWASAFSAHAIAYRIEKGFPILDFNMAVLVQARVKEVIGGVLNTMDIQDRRANVVVIDSASSVSQVTNGDVLPNRVIVSKRTRRIVASQEHLPGWAPTVETIRLLTDAALLLEQRANQPLDVEWCAGANGAVMFLQARALPYSNRESTPLVLPAWETSLRSGKIQAARLAHQLGLTQWQPDVIAPTAFRRFVDDGRRVDADLISLLTPLFQKHLEQGEVSIRPAYWSDIHDGDQLRQSGRLTSVQACFDSLTEFWNDVRSLKLDDYSSEVACMVSTWLPVYASAIGCGRASGPDRQATIDSIYGALEGLETENHDSYQLDLNTLETTAAQIRFKPTALFSLRKGRESVPESLRTLPVLEAGERKAMATYLSWMLDRYPQVRMEFIVTSHRGADSVLPWQIDDLSDKPELPALCELITGNLTASSHVLSDGPALVVRGPLDLSLLRTMSGAVVVLDLIDPSFRDRKFRAELAILASANNASVALIGSTLSHISLGLHDLGIPVYGIGSLPDGVVTGRRVQIIRAQGPLST